MRSPSLDRLTNAQQGAIHVAQRQRIVYLAGSRVEQSLGVGGVDGAAVP